MLVLRILIQTRDYVKIIIILISAFLWRLLCVNFILWSASNNLSGINSLKFVHKVISRPHLVEIGLWLSFFKYIIIDITALLRINLYRSTTDGFVLLVSIWIFINFLTHIVKVILLKAIGVISSWKIATLCLKGLFVNFI